ARLRTGDALVGTRPGGLHRRDGRIRTVAGRVLEEVTNLLCTQEDVELQLQIRFDNDPEPVVAYLIENATGLIRDHCGQHLESQDGLTVTVDGTGGPWLFMPETPIRAVSAVVEDGRTLGADEFVWYRDGSLLRVTGRWVRKPQAVPVTSDAGSHPIPAGLRAAGASDRARR